ncbi:MAG: aldo/keto reductase [Rhodospirillaceae bacterium]|nr:aldo/keto reductase [Rhodospirillaceae bacterium]
MTSSLSRQGFLQAAGAVAATLAAPRLVGAAEGALITRAIPKTGEQIPVVGLGTASSFAGSGDKAAQRDVIKALLDGGATLIDTAPSYAQAEEATGQALKGLGARAKAFVATKVRVEGKDNGIASFNDSFKKLKTDKIDLMQVHNLVDTATHLATMREWKAQGRFRYAGITHWQPDAQEALAPVMRAEEIDFVQLNYSVDVRQPEKTLLPLAQDKGIAVLVNVPLGRGRLLQAMKDKEVPAWAREMGCESFAQMLLKFVISHPAVTCAIPATSKAKNMIDNLGAARGRVLEPKEREKIAEFWVNA